MPQKLRTDYVASRLPKVSHGDGCYVYDTDGKQYIDGSGGPAVFSLGHAHPEVNQAIRDQLDRIAHGYRYTFTSDPLEELNDRIRTQAGPGLDNIIYVSSGSEAMESALKIAMQCHWNRGDTSRHRFIARQRSYHGNTLGALAVSGFAQRRRQFESGLVPCSFVSAANSYRPAVESEGEALAEYLADELEQLIVSHDPQTFAAFVFEPIVGAAGGVVPAPPGYAQRVQEVCRRHGLLLIADEVMCGAGRCGTWRALEHDGVVPDIMTVAKGLGGGYIPLGGVMYSDDVAALLSLTGGPNTGHTFTGHTLACAAAAKVQEIVMRDGLVARVRDRGRVFLSALRERLESIDAVGDVRGRGYFVGVELVADRAGKKPFDPELQLTEVLRARTLEEGLICYPVSGTIDGVNGDVAILSPPYIATDAELDEIVDKFDRGLRQALVDVN